MPKITILAYLLGPGHIKQFDWYPEFNVFILAGKGEDLHRLNGAQCIDHVAYHNFGRRGARRNANNFDIMQPLRLYFAAIGD
jgi:hypothetical protein